MNENTMRQLITQYANAKDTLESIKAQMKEVQPDTEWDFYAYDMPRLQTGDRVRIPVFCFNVDFDEVIVEGAIGIVFAMRQSEDAAPQPPDDILWIADIESHAQYKVFSRYVEKAEL